MSGIKDSAPYFYVDFSNSEIVVWSTTCTYDSVGNCSDEPVYAESEFDGSGLPKFGTFESLSFNGFTVSGNKYLSQVCFGKECVDEQVYSVDNITSDSWLLNENAAYGIIGLGTASTLW